MKSKTSLFNRTIIRNLLQRYWVLFAAYLSVMGTFLLIPLLNSLQEVAEKAFIHKHVKSGNMMHLDNSSVMYLPMPALSDLMRAEQLKKLNQQVETVLDFMSLCGDFE